MLNSKSASRAFNEEDELLLRLLCRQGGCAPIPPSLRRAVAGVAPPSPVGDAANACRSAVICIRTHI